MHQDQIEPTDDVVRALVADQFPAWADEPIRHLRSSGTVNTIFRIGERHAARFPLLGTNADDASRVLQSEVRAGARFAGVSPFPSPVPVGVGRPGCGYPLPWSVQTWLTGTDASKDDSSHSDEFARDLATLIAALRGVETRGHTPVGDHRGGNLRNHDKWVERCLARSTHLLDVPRLTLLWQHFRALPRRDADRMTHGDLIPANVLVAGGRLAGVLDCGGFAATDPALDVIAGWHMLDDRPRTVFRAELGSDDLEWERSKAWAFEQALGAVWYYVDTNPTMSRMGRRTLDRIVAATPI